MSKILRRKNQEKMTKKYKEGMSEEEMQMKSPSPRKMSSVKSSVKKKK